MQETRKVVDNVPVFHTLWTMTYWIYWCTFPVRFGVFVACLMQFGPLQVMSILTLAFIACEAAAFSAVVFFCNATFRFIQSCTRWRHFEMLCSWIFCIFALMGMGLALLSLLWSNILIFIWFVPPTSLIVLISARLFSVYLFFRDQDQDILKLTQMQRDYFLSNDIQPDEWKQKYDALQVSFQGLQQAVGLQSNDLNQMQGVMDDLQQKICQYAAENKVEMERRLEIERLLAEAHEKMEQLMMTPDIAVQIDRLQSWRDQVQARFLHLEASMEAHDQPVRAEMDRLRQEWDEWIREFAHDFEGDRLVWRQRFDRLVGQIDNLRQTAEERQAVQIIRIRDAENEQNRIRRTVLHIPELIAHQARRIEQDHFQEEECFICHDTIQSCDMYTMPCCNVQLHNNCFLRWISVDVNNGCAHCRADLP